ncbi:DUF2637 domain-containing protein [Streptomyces sp. PKU-MA01144]|uniref:DUF2637 domain-containing protein n=1 Tax=Streptomyces TaxID=1883 RepID=UPI00147E2B89|nr:MULTISPECIES: DUF2637 domain-containing protein [Streptomyces]MCY0984399.1 DUF2637 domain-containing protein [Streptomyces tirandamycinicus]NNJ03951.1 DUF2637 domain-containing protein [Streptomyces sp. PKU-MA01144]
MAAMQLTRTHRILIGVVVAGAVIIAAIGFAGSYAAVRELAEQKGFGRFSLVFPIGIDAGICVLLALDLLLTWIRIPFPLLRQTAWLLTAATIAFNGAAAWPDPLGVGMHAVIPVLFVVSVEAARHAVGRIADITADKHMEGVRLTRWLLSPVPTFRLWRRMKLWELRSYEQVIKLEQDRLIYQARLQARFGRAWRRKAPVEALMPLRLAKYGVPLAETAPAGLAAAGIEPMLLPPDPARAEELSVAAAAAAELPAARPGQQEWPQPHPDERFEQPEQAVVHESPWFSAPQLAQEGYAGAYDPAYDEGPEPRPVRPAGPVGPGVIPGPRSGREPGPEQERDHEQEPGRGSGHGDETAHRTAGAEHTGERQPDGYGAVPQYEAEPQYEAGPQYVAGPPQEAVPRYEPEPKGPAAGAAAAEDPFLDDEEFAELAYPVFKAYTDQHGSHPTSDQLDIHLTDVHGIHHPRSASLLRKLNQQFQNRYQADMEAEHIA